MGETPRRSASSPSVSLALSQSSASSIASLSSRFKSNVSAKLEQVPHMRRIWTVTSTQPLAPVRARMDAREKCTRMLSPSSLATARMMALRRPGQDGGGGRKDGPAGFQDRTWRKTSLPYSKRSAQGLSLRPVLEAQYFKPVLQASSFKPQSDLEAQCQSVKPSTRRRPEHTKAQCQDQFWITRRRQDSIPFPAQGRPPKCRIPRPPLSVAATSHPRHFHSGEARRRRPGAQGLGLHLFRVTPPDVRCPRTQSQSQP